MRKHFLLLFLLTLLPLAGWAAWTEKATETNISDGWSIALFTTVDANTGAPVGAAVDRATYTGSSVAPYVFLVKGEEYIKSSNFNVVWKDGSGNEIAANQIINVIPGGNYTVAVTGTDYITYGSLPAAKATASFWVTKATAEIAIYPVLSGAQVFTGGPLNLLTTEATLTSDFNENAVIEYSTDGETWAAGMPKATKAAVYSLSYRVVGNSNINGIPATAIAGTTSITGYNFDPTDHINVPTPKATLAFTWDATEGKAVAQGLINPGSLKGDAVGKGTFMYKVGAGDWSTDIPTGTNAGDYVVSWKIVGDPAYGYYDYTAGADVDVNIAKATPTINATATAASNLKYPGDAGAQLALLATQGTATMGAKYLIKAPGDADFAATAVAFADVKGKNAGDYKIKPVIEASTNYNAVTPADDAALVVTANIAKAQALTAAPTAIAGLTWNNAPQKLFNAGEGTISGKVKYILTAAATPAPATDDAGWKTAIDDASLKGVDAATYYAWYQVTDANYVTVEPTPILGANNAPVKIAPATVSIIVNNASKTYDATGKIKFDAGVCDIAPVGGAKFTVTNAVATAAVNVATLKYTDEDEVNGLGDDYKNADTYEGALTTTAAAVAALNGTWGTNYEYTIVPGNLIINPRPIYVEANAGLNATFGEDFDISKGYTIKGGEAGDVDASAATAEQIANFFTTAPVLKAPTAIGTPVPVDVYDIEFTAGTTAANYTMDLTQGENLDGYFINGKTFEVVEDPNHKLVITVKPHTQKYTGVAESWANLEEGVDYVVSGLIAGDVITKKPTFTREDADKFDVKYNVGGDVIGYTLSADGVEVTNKAAHYPGGIVYNNSTFTIEPVELTATVAPQTILTTANTAELANAALDQDAWTVTGLVGPDATTGKSVLGATLAVNTTTSGTAATGQEKANLGNVEVYGWGIKLSIKAKGNYTLKENTEYGELRVILPTTIELNDAKDMTATLTAANNVTDKTVTFNSRTLKKDTWNTLILPFDITVRALSNKLGYAVVDMLDVTNADPNKVIFKIATGTIKANTPFMIKTDAEVNLQGKLFTPGAGNDFAKIVYTAATTCEVADKAGNKMTGAYKPQTVNDGEYYMTGSGSWKKYEGDGFNINGERVKFTKASASVSAPVFYIEEGDGTMTVIDGETTAIMTISAESLKANDGWYTLNGVKLQSMPTEKGIYINNGKKVVIK